MTEPEPEDDCHIVLLDEAGSGSSSTCSRTRRSAVWTYFSLNNNNQKKDLVICDICTRTVKTKDSGTSNLYSHLKHNHPVLYGAVATAVRYVVSFTN